MIRLLALTLFVSGCASNPPCTVEFGHEPASLDSVLLPAPINLQIPDGITNETSHWEVTHEDWAALVQWQSEVDRYLRDLRDTWKNALEAVNDHNIEHEPKKTEKIPEKSSAWSKLRFWERNKTDTEE